MLKKQRAKTIGGPAMRSHAPSSGNSQDISHVLASLFKDFYKKDVIKKNTSSKVIKTKRDKSDYDEKYLEALQEAQSEYDHCIKEANMLEKHIIQARAQATEKENLIYERMKQHAGDVPEYQELMLVKPCLNWCLDQELLQKHNLISPEDYLTPHKCPSKIIPPPIVKSNVTKPTQSFLLHTESRSGGRSVITQKPLVEMQDLECTFECNSDSGQGKRALRQLKEIKPKPKWKGGLSVYDRAEGLESLQKMKELNTFLYNPRFLRPNVQQGGSSLVRPKPKPKRKREHERNTKSDQSFSKDPIQVFVANPETINFTEYFSGRFYEATLELKNVTSSCRHVRVIPPSSPYFSIGLGRFPSEAGIIAPGMSCKYTVHFAPDSLCNYKDCIVVESQSLQSLMVPIEAHRPPPILTLPPVLNCGYCLVGGVKFIEFVCRNIGKSAATFCIVTKQGWPPPNIRCSVWTYFTEEKPFAMGPSLFTLLPNEARVLEAVFFPITAEKCSQAFTLVCDNCQVKDVLLEGEGQQIALELLSTEGEMEAPAEGEVRDLTAQHFVQFSSCNPNSTYRKTIFIRNNVHLELPFHWQIMEPNLYPLLPGETADISQLQFNLATDGVFNLEPSSGLLPPCQDQEFQMVFCPKQLKDYHSVCHLVLTDVPQVPLKPVRGSALHPVKNGSKVSNVTVIEIEVKGLTEQYKILLEPYALIFPGENLIQATFRRQFKMWNHNKTFVLFEWEKYISTYHKFEVDPPAGRIEENECFDFELIVSGGKAEKLETMMICNIKHRHEPVVLLVEVTFKGPEVKIGVPSLDFGFVQLGEKAQVTLPVENTTSLEATWKIAEKHDGPKRSKAQICVEPSFGVLPPFGSINVEVFFKPRFYQNFQSELELTVLDGTGCHICVQGVVQAPQVCLLNCKLVLPEYYVGISNKSSVKLFNQTLQPTHFRWMDRLGGRQGSLCSVTFDPSFGELGPNETVEITVHFITHLESELTDVLAFCEVQRMKAPLVLCIYAPPGKKLSVSYSLPDSCRSMDDHLVPVLDFGDDVLLKTEVTRQLLMTNQTAIPAHFIVMPEFFNCSDSYPNTQIEKRIPNFSHPLLCAQGKKLEEKAHEDFVSSVLAHGKGAAFLVEPPIGVLEAFQTQILNVTVYTDMWGEYSDNLVCKVGELEPVLIPMKVTVKGCPLYFQIIGPKLENQHQGPIVHLGTHIYGGKTVSRSFRINNPTLFDIRVDWETYNIDHGPTKLVDLVVAYGEHFPLKDADGNEVISKPSQASKRRLRISKRRMPINSSMPSFSEIDEEDGEVLQKPVRERKEEARPPSLGGKKLFSVFIRPYLGNLSDHPFSITPRQITIPRKSKGIIRVCFTPLTLSESDNECKCLGLAMGFISLNSEIASCLPGKVLRPQGLDLQPIRMDLLATVKPAMLAVLVEDEKGVVRFAASAGDLVRQGPDDNKLVVHQFEVTATFKLKNRLEMPLHFRLETHPPFSVVQPIPKFVQNSSNSSSGDDQALVIQPQRSVQVKVAFHCSTALLEENAEEKVSPSEAMQIHCECDPKKLKYQEYVFIHHSNGTFQKVPLRAQVILPKISMSDECIDFGLCYIEEMVTRDVMLRSVGAHTYWSSIIESSGDDAHVFKVTPDSGHLNSQDLHANKYQQNLEIGFTPSEEREFNALVVIKSPLVKTILTLQLKGVGSFDNVHKTILRAV